MVDRFEMLASVAARSHAFWSLVLVVGLLTLAALSSGAPPVQAPPPYVYVPRAHLVDVMQTLVGPGSAPMPGAGARSFQEPETPNSGIARFEIRWYANPPGIPPGVVILLESIQERSPLVKNHVLQLNGKSEGYIRSIIEIPPEKVRQAGRVLKWRVRVVWRGKLLASQSSANWDG
jgi:hypothetical protein